MFFFCFFQVSQDLRVFNEKSRKLDQDMNALKPEVRKGPPQMTSLKFLTFILNQATLFSGNKNLCESDCNRSV